MVKKVFITGIEGLLGSTLAKYLLDIGGYEVTGIDNGIGGVEDNVPKHISYIKGDILDIELVKKAMEGCDTVFHAAALPYEGLSVFSPTVTATSIVSGTLAVAVAALHNNIRLFINCSSMARYGDQIAPFTEDMPTKPVDPYGLAKVQAEQHLQLLSEIHGLNYLTVVPHNIIGVGQRYYDPFRNVVAIMINRTLQDKPIVIYGDGEQQRSFSNAIDCVTVIEKIISSKDNLCGEVFNIGPTANEISINELASKVAFYCDKPLETINFPDRPREVKIAHCSSNKVIHKFNYTADNNIDATLKEMVQWIKPITKPFEYHLPLELITKDTPLTWSKKLI